MTLPKLARDEMVLINYNLLSGQNQKYLTLSGSNDSR